MRFHSIASFILRRHRAVIPAADLAVSPAQCRYLEQERRIEDFGNCQSFADF